MTLNIGDIATHTIGKSTQIINNDVSRDANIQIQIGFFHLILQVFYEFISGSDEILWGQSCIAN